MATNPPLHYVDLSPVALSKLQAAEREINQVQGSETIVLLAVSKQPRPQA